MTEVTENHKEKPTTDSEDLSQFNLDIIDGIDRNTIFTLKTQGITTIEELIHCNPFEIQAQIKIPLHKIMVLRKKAQMLLRLRFDEIFITRLADNGYTIFQALHEDPQILKKITQLDSAHVVNFLDKLTQLSIFIDSNSYKKISTKHLPKTQTINPDSASDDIVAAKKSEREQLEAILENSEVSLLLERMLEGYIKELTPRWVLNSRLGVSYPEAEEIVHPRNEVTYPILMELNQAGILNRHFYDKVSRCPICQYATLMLRNTCIRCSSRNLVKEEMIEHYDCAHVDLESRYKADNEQLTCPKCAKELTRLGLDYSKPGVMFVCRSCGDITGSPYQKLYCLNCGSMMKKDEGLLDDIWTFTLNEEKNGLLIDLLNPKYTLITMLTEYGFKFESDDVITGKIRGKSEVLHFYDIYGEKDGNRLLMEFFSDENQVELSSVYDLIAKAHDISANIVILFAFPVASPEVKKFATYHNISILEGENLANIIPIFENQLDDILATKFKPFP